MIATLTALILATSLPAPLPRFLNRDEIVARFAGQCRGKAVAPTCKTLLADLERVLLYDIELLENAGERVEPDVLRLALSRHNPMLKAKALTLLAQAGLSADDEGLVAEALSSPYLGVRKAALAGAQALRGSRLARFGIRDYEKVFGRRAEHDFLYELDVAPSADSLGAPLYAGATYFPLASGPKCAFFTTTDAPEKVIARLGAGKPALMAEGLAMRLKTAETPPDPATIIQMMRGKEPAQLKEQMQKLAEGSARPEDWTRFEDKEGVETPRYVVVAEADFFGRKLPKRVVAVFRDTILDRTAIVYSLPERNLVSAMGPPTSRDYEMQVRIYHMLQARPAAHGVDPTVDESPASDDEPPTPTDWQMR